VLQQHLGTLLAVPVEQQPGRTRPAPVPMALGAGRPAVGRGTHPSSDTRPGEWMATPAG
jgi:hypothetical protein